MQIFSYVILYLIIAPLYVVTPHISKTHFPIPSDTEVFNTSSERLKKVTTSWDQTRRHRDVWKKTSDLQRLKDVRFTSS